MGANMSAYPRLVVDNSARRRVAMNDKTRSIVLADGDRPLRISKTKLGSFRADLPKFVGSTPVSARKVSTDSLNCSDIVIMDSNVIVTPLSVKSIKPIGHFLPEEAHSQAMASALKKERADDVRETLAALLRDRGIDMKEASIAIGRSHSYIQQYIKRGSPRVLEEMDRRKLAKFLKVPETLLGAPPALDDEAPLDITGIVDVPARTSMPSNFPVQGVGIGGDDGDFHFNGSTVDYVRRPPALANIKNAFGIYLQGDSMWPRFESGELLYIHPGRPVSPGDYVLVELYGKDGEPGSCYVKRLVRRTADKIILQQFNPPRDDISVQANRVKAIFKILSATELLGV